MPIPSPSERVVEREPVEPVGRKVARVLAAPVRRRAAHALVEADVAELDPPEPDLTIGLCGSSAVSVAAWCLRCTATHSRGRIPVVIQITTRHGNAAIGCTVRARCGERAVEIHGGREDRELRDDERRDHGRDDVVTPASPPRLLPTSR